MKTKKWTGKPGAFEYRRIFIGSRNGEREAERLLTDGWMIIQGYGDTLELERPKNGRLTAEEIESWREYTIKNQNRAAL